MNNSKRINTKNQEILKGFFLSKEFLTDPELFFEKMTKAERTAFDRLIAVWKKEGNNFSLSNERLANIMGCSGATVNRWKARWIEHGLLSSEAVFAISYGPKTRQKPNCYSLSPYFKSDDIVSTLGHLLPSLKLLALALLTVFNLYSSHGLVDKLKYNNLYIRRDIRTLSINNNGLAWRIVERSGRMSLCPDDVIPMHVRSIKELSLTQAGQMRLSAYPGSAITYARNGMRRTKKFLKNPFAYFVAMCEQYCKECDIKPDWKLVELTKQVFGWKSDSPMLKSLAVNAKVPCKISSDTTHPSEARVHQGISQKSIASLGEPSTPDKFLKREHKPINLPILEPDASQSSFIETSNLSLAKRLPFMQYKDPQTEKNSMLPQINRPPRPALETSWESILPEHKQYATKPALTSKGLQFLSFCGLKEPS